MIKVRLVVCFLMSCVTLANAQGDILAQAWTTADGANRAVVDRHADKIISRSASGRSDQRRLQIIFHKAHQSVLRNYVPYAGIEELARGTYDCLTGTAFLAGMLHKAGYDFDIMETNYHIFMIVRTSKGEVLLEATDPLNGFITGEKSINARMKKYRTSKPAIGTSQIAHAFDFQILREVSPGQLAGLLRYNQAVKAYNLKAWEECSAKLAMAKEQYNSPRVEALALILLQTVIMNEVEEEMKESIRTRWIDIADRLPVASR